MSMITSIVPMTSIEEALKRITPLNSSGQVSSEETSGQVAGHSFSDMLRGMLDSVNKTDAQTKVDAYDLAMGFADMQDLHNIEINAVKADLALRMVTSVRNRALDAYTEIMRITI